ncbi:MAG: cupin domain-containing protein [Oscillospiraceae bacterium]|nr:cupin domain-containing protein [Oscillospiraceae bacterium]
MIRKENDIRTEKRAIGGGEGEIVINHRMEKDEMFGKCRLCAELVIAPGCSIGQHIHEAETEIFYVLEGELVSIGADGNETVFAKGDVMSTGGGGSHALRNDTDKNAVLFAVIAV